MIFAHNNSHFWVQTTFMSSLHWSFSLSFLFIFIKWSIFPTTVISPSPPFPISCFQSSTLKFEGSNTMFLRISHSHTPLYDNAPKWERKTPMETTSCHFGFTVEQVINWRNGVHIKTHLSHNLRNSNHIYVNLVFTV